MVVALPGTGRLRRKRGRLWVWLQAGRGGNLSHTRLDKNLTSWQVKAAGTAKAGCMYRDSEFK